MWSATDLAGDPHAVEDKPERVRSMFAAIAPAYDLNNRLHSLGRDQAWRRATVRACGVQPTDAVLDVACGTGDLAEAFAAAGPARVVGVDFTEEMLEIARRKSARETADRTPIEYRWADAQDLPFEDASFDVVSIAFGLRNVADPARALREFRRVLRPGGRLAVLEFTEPSNPIVRGFNRVYCRWIMPRTASLIARDRSGAYHYLPRSVATFLEPGALTRLIEDAGFTAVDVRSMTLGICACYLGRVP